MQINPNGVAPDHLEPKAPDTRAVEVAEPSRLVIRAIPAAILGACTLAAYMLAGGAGAVIAVLTGLACWISFDIAARRLGTLAEHNRRLRTTRFMQESINAVPMPIFVKNRHGRLIMINDAYCEQRHLTRDEILGKTASELAATPELARLIADEDRAVLNDGRIRKEETITHPLTGKPLHQIVTKALSHTETGRPIIIGTFVDVTDIRNAEQDVRNALGAQTRLRGFLQSVLDALPNPLFVKDVEHRYIMVNRAHTETTGMSAQALRGKRAADVFGNETGVGLEAQEDNMLAGPEGVVYESEHSIPDRQGNLRQEILRKVVGHDPEGRRVIIGTATNITSLRHAEARWQFALEGAGDGLWDWDIAAARTYYSPRWKAMQGFGEDEISDSDSERTRRIHPDDMQAAQAALEVHLSGRVPVYVCELRQLTRDSGYMWILDRGQVVERDSQGTPRRMIGVYTDITHQRQAADELRQHRDRLKDMVEEQTVDLLRAKEEAEKANAAKSQFLANMSHELRTPMHAVLSFASLGEEKANSAAHDQQTSADKLATYFQRIRESGERLLALLNDLLDLSKIEAGRMVLQIQSLNLQDLLQETLREFEASLLARQLEATIRSDSPDTFVMADPVRMAQVVRNLLSNAIKFSPEGGRITLRLQPLMQAGNLGRSVELIVSDDGPGIPEQELEAVFDKFVQSSKTRSNAGGTGLGLPICREIINAHHGEIFARNGRAGGAEFIVRIPRHAQNESSTTEARA